MYLIQLLLPVHDNDGQAFDHSVFDAVRRELTERFGGVTAFLRSPAVGLWKESPGDLTRDDVVMFEVMCPELDPEWWSSYRKELETIFRQEELVPWAAQVSKLYR